MKEPQSPPATGPRIVDGCLMFRLSDLALDVQKAVRERARRTGTKPEDTAMNLLHGAFSRRSNRTILGEATESRKPIERPTSTGWYWWRPHALDPWVTLQVILDPTKDELLVRTDEDDLYQCDGDALHDWYGEWHPVKLEPPAR